MILYIYSISLILFSFFTYLFVDINFIYLKNFITRIALDNRIIVSTIYFVFISSFFILYALILNKNKIETIFKHKFTLCIVAILLLLAYPAYVSYDIFNYIATAKVTFFYFENPYVVMPIEFTKDPVLLFTHAANKLALYGPFWIILSGIPFMLSFGNYLVAIFLFKLISAGFFVGLCYLILKITNSKFSLVLFSLSPLVLLETFVSGHNDTAMMFLALFSFYLIQKKKIILAIVFIMLSILIKFATAILLPVIFYCVYKKFKKQNLNWNNVWLISFLLMLIIFFLSFLREEIYPWYAIWPLTFLVLMPQKKNIIILFSVFTYGLMLRYLPYMLLGDHFGITPILKIIFMTIPVVVTFFFLYINKKIRAKF